MPAKPSHLILVADDDEDVRTLLRTLLSEAGYQVITARDGEQALRLAARCAPDLCVLDVMMPAVDGYDVTRVLRNLKGAEGMPIVLLTARTSETDEARGDWSGADRYIRKPFRVDDLLTSIRNLTAASA